MNHDALKARHRAVRDRYPPDFQIRERHNHLSGACLVWNALLADRNRSRSIDRGWPEVGDAALA